MKKLLLLGLIGYGCYAALGKVGVIGGRTVEPLYGTPYVVVYGRDRCGLTQSMKQQLARSRVPFDYEIIDDPAIADRVHSRMERFGLSTRRYRLPVVDVSGRLFVSPNPHEVVAEYDRGRA